MPEVVSSSSSDPDRVVVTFWADDLFQAENGKSLRRGLTISSPIIRQVSLDDSKMFKEYGEIVGYTALAFLSIGLLWSLNV